MIWQILINHEMVCCWTILRRLKVSALLRILVAWLPSFDLRLLFDLQHLLWYMGDIQTQWMIYFVSRQRIVFGEGHVPWIQNFNGGNKCHRREGWSNTRYGHPLSYILYHRVLWLVYWWCHLMWCMINIVERKPEACQERQSEEVIFS